MGGKNTVVGNLILVKNLVWTKKKYRKRKIGNPSSFTNQETIPTNESNQVNSQKGKRYKSEKMNYDENKYKSEKINFEKKKYQSEKIDFNEKISFNEN